MLGANRPDIVLVSETLNGPFQNEATAGSRSLVIDQPVKSGGMGMGPDPFQVLAVSLGACTAQTLRMFLNGRRWSVARIRVAVAQARNPAGGVQFERTVACEGDFSDAEKAELEAVAERTPVTQALGGVKIVTRFGPIGDPEEEARMVEIDHMILMEEALRAS